MIRISALLAVVACGAMLGACASHGLSAGEEALTHMRAARETPVFKGAEGGRETWDELVSSAAEADVVIIGENHSHPLGLAVAAAFWEDVLLRTQNGALSLEFFERDEQSRVDDYLKGVVDEDAFQKATRRTESSYPPGHRMMVEAAKERHRPVIAANAPRVYVHLARQEGGYEKLSKLTAEQRRLFRIPDELPGSNSRYRKDFNKVMSEMSATHGSKGKPPAAAAAGTTAKDPARFDAGFRSQSLWDWTMAESIARGLEAGDAPVVQVVGRFHTDFGGGLVQALKRQRPGARIFTVSFSEERSDHLEEGDRGRADAVIYVGPAPEDGKR